MIVRNDMANLERCLASIANHIGCFVIGDCGSTDGTLEFIRAFYATRGLPGDPFRAKTSTRRMPRR